MCNYAAESFLKTQTTLFKELFLKPPTYVLCRISVVEYSCRSVN
jgi:hypothetical protein